MFLLSCKLAVDFIENIVAHGTIMEITAANPTIHGVALGKDNERVVIDIVLDDQAFLPFPIRADDIFTVGQALGYMVAWPKNLITIAGVQVINNNYFLMKYMCMLCYLLRLPNIFVGVNVES